MRKGISEASRELFRKATAELMVSMVRKAESVQKMLQIILWRRKQARLPFHFF